jgi:hypothetical protein
MNATVDAPRIAVVPDLRVVQVTQHWTIEHGTFYRDCVVELEDGTRRLVGVRDDLLPAVAA